MAEYLPRIVDHELDELFRDLPAISLEGPRGVGKTETALQRATSVFRLDDPAQREIVAAGPQRVLAETPPVLFDEWQRLPDCWDFVRRAVDEDHSPGRFLLTGSAAPTQRPTHSGAGRIVTLRMRPLSLAERALDTPTVSLAALLGRSDTIAGETGVLLEDYAHEIVASGFPGLRHLTGRSLRAQLDGYLTRIVDSDLPQLEHRVRRPQTLRRWMAAYAAATATTATYETIRDAATPGNANKPAKTTTRPYRDLLERLWIVDPVPAWRPTHNRFARLSKPPKHHLADPALAARLLGVGLDTLLSGGQTLPRIPRDGTLLGHLFESLVTLSVRVYAQAAEAQVRHLRTKGGRQEIDLLVERADGRVLALEVKLARTVSDDDVKHLHWLSRKIGDDLVDMAVIHTGPAAFRRPDGVAVIPASLLGS